MKREMELFFDSVVREDHNVLDLLTANYTFVNERLARHYGISNVTGITTPPPAICPGHPRETNGRVTGSPSCKRSGYFRSACIVVAPSATSAEAAIPVIKRLRLSKNGWQDAAETADERTDVTNDVACADADEPVHALGGRTSAICVVCADAGEEANPAIAITWTNRQRRARPRHCRRPPVRVTMARLRRAESLAGPLARLSRFLFAVARRSGRRERRDETTGGGRHLLNSQGERRFVRA